MEKTCVFLDLKDRVSFTLFGSCFEIFEILAQMAQSDEGCFYG